MDRISAWLKKLLFPGGKPVFLLVVLGAVSLFLTFATWLEETPFAYLAYTLSAYGLTVLVAWIVTKAVPGLKRFLHGFSLTHRYLTDDYFKVRAGLLLSFLSIWASEFSSWSMLSAFGGWDRLGKCRHPAELRPLFQIHTYGSF